MEPEQLILFSIVSSSPTRPIIHDPYWDELEQGEVSLMTNEQPLNYLAPQCESVREQVISTTPSTECIDKPVCSLTHWIEKFYVPRSGKKHFYFRYMWMNGRKLHRKYIGSVGSQKAIALKNRIQEQINQGRSPSEILKFLRVNPK